MRPLLVITKKLIASESEVLTVKGCYDTIIMIAIPFDWNSEGEACESQTGDLIPTIRYRLYHTSDLIQSMQSFENRISHGFQCP